ncbi:MAG: peptide chain release factor N(5)-glutamine methyltransferase [Chlorobiaceae bacterium]|nr:peptide chain release factor N(5)-glutamine methyltransferase [Chlorobiaceae bacterium]NTW11081.1 peptide chain release factor N(5)-glutamine methyltransferase [Chlorobiaceae bacterium]
MENPREWLVLELLKTTADFFSSRLVDEPRQSAELLLAHVLGQSRLQLYLNHCRPVFSDELERFRALCRRRLEGCPVQYIVGEQFFYGMRFAVDERVLIPRPETELLVERAVEFLGRSGEGGERVASVLDIGTGSGCIAVAMARLIPSARITAVDKSPGALELARMNAEGHDVLPRICFVEADMFDTGFISRLPETRYDMIVSNPPYIPISEWDGLQREVKDFEPAMALAVPEGLECYRAIAGMGKSLLGNGGRICLEIHADGARGVSAILDAFGFGCISTTKDYSRHDRIVSAILQS